MAGTSFDINNGANQIAPNAMTQNQYFYGEEFARKILGSKDKPLSLVVLGAGVDATIGLPTSADLIPRIVDFLETDEGKTLDAILRKAIGRVHFHFDKFVSTAIDRLAKDLDREIVSICHNINDELANNASLDESQRKLGMLIVRLFKKVLDFKKGAEIDAETITKIVTEEGISLFRRVTKVLMPNGKYRYPVDYFDATPGVVKVSKEEMDKVAIPVYKKLI